MTVLELNNILDELGVTDPTFYYLDEDDKAQVVLKLAIKLGLLSKTMKTSQKGLDLIDLSE